MSSWVSRGKISMPMMRAVAIVPRAVATPPKRLMGWNVALRSFLHQGKRVPVRVPEECHPEIVIVHLGDQVRLAVKDHAPTGKLSNRESDVRAAEIDDTLRLHGALYDLL